MKKLIAIFAAIAALGLNSAIADFDLQGWFSDINVVGNVGFESENHIYGKRIAEETFVSGIELCVPIAIGQAYVGITGYFPLNGKANTNFGPNVLGILPTAEAIRNQRAHNDGGNRFEAKAGYMLPVLCAPLPECLCLNEEVQVSLDVGYKYYWWTQSNISNPWNQVNRSNEVYVGIITDMYLRPAVYVFYDWNLEQLRVEGSIGYTLNLGYITPGLDRFNIEANAYVAWLEAKRYAGDQNNAPRYKNGYAYGGVKLDLIYCLNECADIRVGMRWEANNDGKNNVGATYLPSSAGAYMNQGGKASRFWWGASVNFGF